MILKTTLYGLEDYVDTTLCRVVEYWPVIYHTIEYATTTVIVLAHASVSYYAVPANLMLGSLLWWHGTKGFPTSSLLEQHIMKQRYKQALIYNRMRSWVDTELPDTWETELFLIGGRMQAWEYHSDKYCCQSGLSTCILVVRLWWWRWFRESQKAEWSSWV